VGLNIINSIISNSTANGSVIGISSVGGLVGGNSSSSISNSSSSASGSVMGEDSVGGLVGSNYNSSIDKSTASGSVSGSDDVGGLVGWNYNSSIDKSTASGNVSGNWYVEGLVGWSSNSISIDNSSASGSVTGTGSYNDYIGGLVGWNWNSSISNSIASGDVKGHDFVGGLTGWNYNSSISSSFWDINTTGQTNGCGYGNCSGATGKTTAEMKSLATFKDAGWDIDNEGGTGKIWRIYDGDSYPLLRFFLTPQSITSINAYSKTYDGTAYSGGNGYVAPGADPNFIIYGGTAQGARNVGTYTISLYSNQQGYDLIGDRNANLTINKAALTLSTSDVTKTYDGGLGLGDGSASATVISGTLSTGDSLSGGSFAFTDKNVGMGKAVTVSDITVNDGNSGNNYDLSYQSNTNSIINKANATVTANSATKTYNGQAQSVSGFTASGLVNGEDETVLTNISTTGGTGTNVGTYTHTANGTDGNYNLSFVDGSLSISPAHLRVTANNDSKAVDGQPYSGGNGVAYSGFVNGETNTVLGGALAYGGTSQGALMAGHYGISPSGLISNNYTITFIDGSLVINAIKMPDVGELQRDTSQPSGDPSDIGQPHDSSGLMMNYTPSLQSIGEHNGFPGMGSAFVTLAPGYVPFAPGVEEAAIAVGDPPAAGTAAEDGKTEGGVAEDEERAKRRRGRR
jgi:hypothetical protein